MTAQTTSRLPRRSLSTLCGVIWMLGSFLPSLLAAGALTGTVVDRSGAPIEGASIRIVATREVTRTGANGEFALDATAPVELVVEHIAHETRRLDVPKIPDQPLEIVLAPRPDVVVDEIAVSASRSQGSFSPQSVSATVLSPDGAVELPSVVGELVAQVPGVSENGQGGLFQTYSVRGVSRQRVLTLIEGMRIVSERRAGVSASFIDPLLLGSAEVVRGPSSTYWGSGALGGVVQLFPRRFQDFSLALGVSTAGDERFVRVGQGSVSDGDGWSWGVAAREAGIDETPSGSILSSGFEQVSATFSRLWSRGEMTYEAVVLASVGNDIGKANTDFPERATVYPSENHTLAHISASHARGWRLEAWAHPNDLETRVETVGEGVTVVDNRALDWGIDLQRERRLSERRTVRWGVDLFAREGVEALEESRDIEGGLVLRQETLSGATEQELGVYGAIEATVGAPGRRSATVLAGGRLAHQAQGGGAASTDDSAATAFLGAVVPLSSSIELTANLGTGLRFPSISERYFTGTTGRGFVTGNPSLEPERSASADVGVRWIGNRAFVSGSLFRSDIDSYIERIEASPDRLTFVNLGSGRILGVEFEGTWQPTAVWSLGFGGHAIEGEASDGTPLADIPAERLHAGVRWQSDSWAARSRWEHRFEKNELGSGEKTIPAADLVSAGLTWKAGPGFEVRLSVENLLDETYFNSADRRVPLAPTRSFAVALAWR